METNILEGPAVPPELLKDLHIPAYQLITTYAKDYLENVCVIDAVSGEKILFSSVLSECMILAGEMQALGCKPGHVIGIICENRYEYCVILMAALCTGATVACFNPMYSIGELEHTLAITTPFLIFANSNAARKLNNISHTYRTSEYVIDIDDQFSSDFNYKTLTRSKGKNKYVTPKVGEDYTAIILFSSGSTGLPKGVMMSSRNLTFILKNFRYTIEQNKELQDESKMLCVIPFFHSYGATLMLRTLISGQTVVVLKKFGEEIFLATIQRYRINILPLVPTLMVFLAKHPLINTYDLSSIRHIICGAASLSVSIEEAVKKRFKLDKIGKGYAMTEMAIAVTSNIISDDKPGSVGTLAFGMKAKVLDLKTGESLGPNKKGELCFKGFLIMKGYYRNEEETRKTVDKDGWLHTGDVGYYDEDGHFFIVDRIKDLIKYKGFQVPPAELEALLIKHELIRDAAVIGIPDETTGELPKAFVVKQGNITEREITNYISVNVAPHMKLRGGVTFVNEIPRNSNGKILRRILRNYSQSKL